MTETTSWIHSNAVVGAAVGVLVVLEVFFLVSDLGDAVRYTVMAVLGVCIVAGVYQLSANRRLP